MISPTCPHPPLPSLRFEVLVIFKSKPSTVAWFWILPTPVWGYILLIQPYSYWFSLNKESGVFLEEKDLNAKLNTYEHSSVPGLLAHGRYCKYNIPGLLMRPHIEWERKNGVWTKFCLFHVHYSIALLMCLLNVII